MRSGSRPPQRSRPCALADEKNWHKIDEAERNGMTQSAAVSLLQAALRPVFGRRLSNAEGEGHKIGAVSGLAAMGLDGLSSAAYGP